MSEAAAVATTPAAPAAEAPPPTTPTNAAPDTAPKEGAPPPTEAAAKPEGAAEKPEEKPKDVEPKEFLALKREKARLHKEQQALKTERQQVEQAMTQIVAPVREVLDKFDDNPLGALEFLAKAKGKTLQEVFDTMVTAAAKHGDPPDPNDRVSKLERQLRERDEAEKKKHADAEAQAIAEAEKAMRADVSAKLGQFLSSDPERFESLLARDPEKTHNDLMDLAEAWHTEHGEPLSAEQAADLLEARYLAEDEVEMAKRFSRSRKKLSKYYAPPEPAPQAPAASATPEPTATPANAAPAAPPAAAPAAGNTANKTLPVRPITQRQAAVPAGVTRVIRKPSSDREIIERAAALMPTRFQQR